MSEAQGVPAGGSGLSGEREAQHHPTLQDCRARSSLIGSVMREKPGEQELRSLVLALLPSSTRPHLGTYLPMWKAPQIPICSEKTSFLVSFQSTHHGFLCFAQVKNIFLCVNRPRKLPRRRGLLPIKNML